MNKETKTIGQQIKWDFESNGYLEIKDKNDKEIYYENSCGYWRKWEYNSGGNLIYFENSNGDWERWECDSQGGVIYSENSRGTIRDNRPKPFDDKVVEIDGIKYKLVKLTTNYL